MPKSLENALSQKAWSVSEVMFDLDAMLDDEGRPISERRADAMARVGVEMEMKPCPFNDLRHGHWMNVSALAQITRYLTPVLREMESFRNEMVTAPSWGDILTSIIDQLSGPAIYLLQQRMTDGPVPAQIAVGHKLAAGMFGVIRELHQRLAQGRAMPVTVESFLRLIDETAALMGASEACAGSPSMIRKATNSLINGNPDNPQRLLPQRIHIAGCLSIQVQLGIFWRLFDRGHLWDLMQTDIFSHLMPFNDFLKRKLETTRQEMDVAVPVHIDSHRLPESLDQKYRKQLIAALNNQAAPELLYEDINVATELLNTPGAAIEYRGEIAPLAQCIARYLHTYRLFRDTLCHLEQQLRGYLGYSAEPPVKLGLAVFPAPSTLQWYERIVGRRLGEEGHLTGTSTGVRVNSAPTAARL